MTYFSFTTLSTVGFGDFYPKSNGERLVVVVVMLFGVAIFSYIMGLFTEILNTFKTIFDPIEEYYSLDTFISVLDSFNSKPINRSIKDNLYSYFEYKWANDVN